MDTILASSGFEADLLARVCAKSPYNRLAHVEPWGSVSPGLCPGHFEHYPALPVAVLMDGLNRLACAHLALHEPRPFRLEHCDVQADRLAPPPRPVTRRRPLGF